MSNIKKITALSAFAGVASIIGIQLTDKQGLNDTHFDDVAPTPPKALNIAQVPAYEDITDFSAIRKDNPRIISRATPLFDAHDNVQFTDINKSARTLTSLDEMKARLEDAHDMGEAAFTAQIVAELHAAGSAREIMFLGFAYDDVKGDLGDLPLVEALEQVVMDRSVYLQTAILTKIKEMVEDTYRNNAHDKQNLLEVIAADSYDHIVQSVIRDSYVSAGDIQKVYDRFHDTELLTPDSAKENAQYKVIEYLVDKRHIDLSQYDERVDMNGMMEDVLMILHSEISADLDARSDYQNTNDPDLG